MKPHESYRPIAMLLGVLLTVSTPAQAAAVNFSEVVQVKVGNSGVNSAHAYPELRLRSASSRSNNSTPIPVAAAASTAGVGVVSTGVSAARAYQAPGEQATIETIEIGEVTGTICDCGEIAIPGGGFSFPKLPLLALGLVPLAFLFDRGSGDTLSNAPFTFATNVVLNPVNTISSTQPSPPPSPSNPIPEPATLLLFGSALVAFGASTCRRRTQSKDALPSKA